MRVAVHLQSIGFAGLWAVHSSRALPTSVFSLHDSGEQSALPPPTPSPSPSLSSSNDTLLKDASWQWMSSEWSECSVPCGGGTAVRSVLCVSTDGQTDPTGTKCPADKKPAASQPCNQFPCTAQFLLDAIKQQTDGVTGSLPKDMPAGIEAILSDPQASGTHSVLSVQPSEVDTVQKSWTVANNWPPEVAKQFTAMIGAESEQYTSFHFSYTPSEALYSVVIGAARNFNGTVDMGFIQANGQGTPVKQHYGSEKKVECGSQCRAVYNTACKSPEPYYCGGPGSGCGPSKVGVCPGDCACTPCNCPIMDHFPHNQCWGYKATCAQLLGGSLLSLTVSGSFAPGTCSTRSLGDHSCWLTRDHSSQTLDFSGCRNPAKVAQCDKPLSADQVQLIAAGLSSKARPQLFAHANLLAASLRLKPPYDDAEGGEKVKETVAVE
uniref:Uncharacterized protein n=1 Tax=Chromera velia CCMP2878 TaxID=1169474 RepID=A0A0G4I6G7_9ALVE|eukprot:Cvel_11389.t1-p1 / transcript=Cvel_11389.t1 / gene=Cvel_11389 / organism=Chromera_velia_CCMP2878 / gene_product=ADAMTS-like protein 4, putative / transcript_product=ADAMTS-like protein 4, putative / location=Cvel_scaffold714:29731-31129(-) / protein_length=435 / sequence_SO=supercontig / SO=protein_coding / is_pseudo=false